MLIDALRPAEIGLVKPDETVLNKPDENHNVQTTAETCPDSGSGSGGGGGSHWHRHAECLKPYNPKTARKSTGRGPAFKTSVISLSRSNKISQQLSQQHPIFNQNDDSMFSQGSPATRLTYTPDNQNEDPSSISRMDSGMPVSVQPGPTTNQPGGTGQSTARINNGGGPGRINNGGVGPNKFNQQQQQSGVTQLGSGNSLTNDGKRQGSSLIKNQRVTQTQSWKAGKATSDLTPVEPKNISKDVPTKTWKAVRFASTCSRGSNTVPSVNVAKGVQTISTAYKLRLNRWPVWSSGLDYYRAGHPPTVVDPSSEHAFHYPLWTRRILSLIFSQFGIVLFLTSWITGHAALFQHLEQQPDIKLVNDVVSSRNELVITLATELRQVFPYEMAWRRKIDDYFIKFEATLNNATARGYSTHRRAFYKWDYFDFLLFSFQLVTGQGYGTDVPKTEWSLLLSVPCVLIGMPFMWLLLIDLGAKWADTLSNTIQKFRWNMSRRYPEVVSLQTDNTNVPYLPPAPTLNQNGLERFSEETPVVRPYQNGNGGRVAMLANGDAQHDSRFYAQNSEQNSPTLRSVWTVEPVTVAMMPSAPPKAAQLTNLPADEMYHHATPWVATVFIVLYPFVGTLIFGLWANLPITTSFVLPFTSLMLISPPAVFTSFMWRALFHVYLLIGWVLLIACFLLWHQSWRDIIRNWAHDLSIKHYQKTYPLQVR